MNPRDLLAAAERLDLTMFVGHNVGCPDRHVPHASRGRCDCGLAEQLEAVENIPDPHPYVPDRSAAMSALSTFLGITGLVAVWASLAVMLAHDEKRGRR